jgi:hypothetical protein
LVPIEPPHRDDDGDGVLEGHVSYHAYEDMEYPVSAQVLQTDLPQVSEYQYPSHQTSSHKEGKTRGMLQPMYIPQQPTINKSHKKDNTFCRISPVVGSLAILKCEAALMKSPASKTAKVATKAMLVLILQMRRTKVAKDHPMR